MSRASQKLAIQAAIEQRKGMPAIGAAELAAAGGTAGSLVHRQVELRGTWVAPGTVYLDNRQMQAKPGFYVVTPLRLEGAGGAVLVERGWVQRNFTDRAKLPLVETPAGPVVVRGLVAPLPSKLYDFGSAGSGPIRQNLDLAQFRAETGLPLLGVSVQQTGPASEGLLRDWPEPTTGVERHYGYAFQWWALAVLIATLYAWFQFIAPRRKRH
ncbi:SURF1 family protein [Caenimonas sp. DR4.4]|uniref:SURF1-like protein n=2 Tax=Caenimonas aquaedulcis TaxID=2793270 RepID=A0A931H6F9_9BURK|nr:SURF1 family protein [Caenimonas aquaedulcis]